MSEEERKARLESALEIAQMLARTAQLVPLEDAQALVREFDHTETLMPLLDPSGYLRVRDNIPGHKKLAEAFLAFRRVVAEVVGEGL